MLQHFQYQAKKVIINYLSNHLIISLSNWDTREWKSNLKSFLDVWQSDEIIRANGLWKKKKCISTMVYRSQKLTKLIRSDFCFVHPIFRFWVLVTFGDEVTKILRNHCLHFARQNTKNQKTKIWDQQNINIWKFS